MPVRLKDVASRAGVSVSTVSNVLNGYTKSGIKQETCDRVRSVAQELGYRANALARSLKVQRTDSIGFYTGYGYLDPRNRFRAEIYTGILSACERFGLDFHIHANLKDKSPEEIRMRLVDGRVDGVIIHTYEEDLTVKYLRERGFPTVAIADRLINVPSVDASHESGMRALVEYLWKRGHRRMMYLRPEEPRESISRRMDTFQEEVITLGGEPSIAPFPEYTIGSFLHALLQQPDRPTVLCAFNDDTAYMLLRGAREANVRVPEDFAVVGYDGLGGGNATARDLVTAGVPWERIAFESVRLLREIIAGESVPLVTSFPVALIEGDTV